MSDKKIRAYAEIMKEYELTSIEIEDENYKIKINRDVALDKMADIKSNYNIDRENIANKNMELEDKEKDYILVKSPMVGVFYPTPSEDALPYVEVGDDVSKGQTLCIIEAMKLMNEIHSEFDGRIVEVFIKSGEVVEFGTPLFKIKTK